MKKAKSLFVAAALMLITVGVFAGKARFVNYTLWYDNGSGSKIQLTNTFTIFTNSEILADGSGNNNVSIVGTASKGLFISQDGGSTFIRATTSTF